MTAVKTTCAYCGVGCGVIATPDGAGGATIVGDANHPANFGRLCSKGSALGETLALEDRLLTPKIGGEHASWDAATSLVAQKFSDAIAEHGPDSVAFYVSGQLLTEDYYVANKLMKGFIGSANIDTNSRLCMASSVAGHKRAFGTDTVPGTYEDLDQADLVVLVGSNLAWCHPVLHQRIMGAKEQRGTRIINIDPRRTVTAQQADMHLGLNSGSDVALFNGLLRAIIHSGAVNTDYVSAHVNGLADAGATVEPFDIASVSDLTGLSPQDLTEFYEQWIGTKRVVTVYSQGVNQAIDGADKVNSIVNCHLATGRIGQVGCGPFSVTGQPNAMGGREVGGLANMLAAHLDIEDAGHREVVADFWNAPTLPKNPGLKAVDLFKACASGQIKALWIMCTNPAVSMPRADEVADAIRNVDFVVVSDIVEKTDTTVLADVLLPATGWGERDGTVTNSERRISRQRPFLPPPGETRHDWRAICEVATKMGWGEAFGYSGPHQIFREWSKMTALSVRAGKDLDLSNVSTLNKAEYDHLPPVQWPVRSDGADTRFFAKGGFFTPDGRARMLAVTPSSKLEKPNKDYPLVLNTGRIRDQWHTMTRTAKSSRLSQHIAEPFAEVHPKDAARFGIKSAELLRLHSPFGEAILRVKITDKTPVGHVFVPLHWTSQWASKARVDAVVSDAVDPVSGQPELKRTAVSIESFPTGWFGFGVCRDQPTPNCSYWAKAMVKGGWRVELAEKDAPLNFESFARAILGISGGKAVTYADAKTGQNRIAFVENERVVGVLFGASEPVALSRSFLVQALGSQAYADVLAGSGGQDQPDAGPIVCACLNVGLNTIVEHIASGQVASVADIGALLQAGTSCGSCRPELSDLLSVNQPREAAE
ncbi:MAG: molybdopterin-dependent oxidoreductase [Rhodobacteraceae bacterium]|nr:molybdopterin-dependent oxidoreductase [Paracoccaceae bacterium]